MFEALKCRLKGHLYVDSRSQPGTVVCVRCRARAPFEGLGQDTGQDGLTGDPKAASPPDQTRRL